MEKIIEGVLTDIKMNTVGLSKGKEEEIARRREICKKCPLNSVNAEKDGWYTSILPFEHCSVCKCSIELKTACLSCNCGLETINEEPKWKKYDEK